MVSGRVILSREGKEISVHGRARLQRDQAFAAFYEAHFQRVLRAAALFCGDVETARDSAQEAFVRAFEKWGRLEHSPWREGWVMTTAFNLCRRALKRRVIPDGRAATTSSTESDDVFRVDLAAALGRLSRRQRETLVLFYYGDQSVEEIARLLDVSVGSVKTHLSRGRKALERLLDVEVG